MSFDTLYVFGDQSAELLPSIRALHRQSKQCEPLRGFLRAAIDTIQQAWATTPAYIRPRCPPFDSALELAEFVETGWGSAPFISALLSISQLGNLIVHLVGNPRSLESTSKPVFFGICTGSIAAAAAASCCNITELLSLAPETVKISFHLGLEASKRSWLLEDSNDSWTTIVNNINLDTVVHELDTFNRTHGEKYRKRVYISATIGNSVSISGPPSTVEKLFTTVGVFQRCKKFQLPVRAAFHASHLTPVPKERIMSHVNQTLLKRDMQHMLISPSSGTSYISKAFDDILGEIIHEVLQLPIDWQAAMGSLSKTLTHSTVLCPMGPVAALKALRQAFSGHELSEKTTSPLSQSIANPRQGSNAIAIIGMSVRLPGSETLEEFWKVLEEGRDLHEKIRADRFDWRTHCDPTGKAKNTTLTPYGVFIDRPGYFDARFFNMSPREAAQTDPQQRLMLLTTYEALEHAGYSPNRTPSTNTRRIASFIGQTGDDYREVNASQDIDTYFITGGIRAFGPGRVNYHFGWEGPSFSLDTACSSSAASIQLAASALLARECDTAVGGGANLLTTPDLFAGLSRGSFLSKTGGCKTFDHDADGYVRADGCGVIVMKRLEDALTDRDNILAVMRGATTNHSAEAVSITHPHDETQQRLFKAVLDNAGVVPTDVDYAELHGTGTQAGDATESRSVTSILCNGRDSSNPLYLGTVKPNIGHGEAASGVTSIIKAILMMQKNIIPPHIGIKGSINAKLPPLKELNAHISFGKTPFLPKAHGDGKRRILVNNFDAAGGNTSLLLEDPPKLNIEGFDPRGYQVITLSAKSTTAIINNACRLVTYLKNNSGVRLEDIAYTTSARRVHHNVRRAYAVSSCGELVAALEKQIASTKRVERAPAGSGTVFCFTGQGSQYLSMSSILYKTFPVFRELIDEYASICISHDFPSFLPVISGDVTALQSPLQTQLAIVSIEIALASLWRSLGVNPQAVIGHSVGEYAALCFAGVLSPSDCIYLVGKRASLMVQKCTPGSHAMLAVQASSDTLRDMLESSNLQSCELACYNAPMSTSISGSTAEIDELAKELKAKNIKASKLDVPFAFHSAQLDDILTDFGSIANNVQFSTPRIPIASTLLGKIITTDDTFNAQYVCLQARNPVLFQDALRAMKESNIVNDKTVFIETGPNPICLGMVKATLGTLNPLLPTLKRSEDDWKVFASAVAAAYDAGLDIDWSEYHRPFETAVRMLELPNYAFDLKNHWIQYKGDWTLRKGEPAILSAAAVDVQNKKPLFSTSSLHRVEKEVIEKDFVTVTFATDAAEPIINSALRGHVVNGAGLCPSSIYADMAFTAAAYVHELADGKSDLCLDVCNMDVHKPLIITPDSQQIIRVTATLNKSSMEVHVSYSAQDGKIISDHARCLVKAGIKTDWQFECSRHAYLVRSRMDQLVQGAHDGSVHKLLRPMVYKLFTALVDYDEKYQGMEEVHLDSRLQEATAKIKFRTNAGNFTYSPFWIDSISHLSGFVLNGSDTTPADSVFISHGWGSMKFLAPLSADKRYRSYVRMQPTKTKGVLAGDVYLFEDEEVVGLVENLKFQQIKRSMLNHLLPSSASPKGSEPRRPATVPSRTISSAAQTRTTKPKSSGTPAKALPLKTASTNLQNQENSVDFEVVLDIIAQEVGLDRCELDDQAEFASLGVDSLLTISILANLSQQLGQELPASLFIECPSVEDLRTHFATSKGPPTSRNKSLAPKEPVPTSTSRPSKTTIPKSNTIPSEESEFDKVLELIADEIGMDVFELDDDADFANLGVDSLLTISILTNLNQQMGYELPASLFIEYSTVGDLRGFFGTEASNTGAVDVPTADTCYDSESESASEDEVLSGHETPNTPISDYENVCVPAKFDTIEMTRKIIAQEIGIPPQEIEPDVELIELGVDSLLSLSILTRLKEQVGMVLPSTFFIENTTFADIEQTLRTTSQYETTKRASVAKSLPKPDSNYRKPTSMWKASSILLQGSSLSRNPCLFLIPDGSGSASSYVGLPPMHLSGPVYGLNSPFLANPTALTGSLQDVVTYYIDEIKRVQPEGPYYIGGWSVGGIFAFEAASQLINQQKDEVAALVLIDTPCPTVYPPLPMDTINFLTSIGAFDSLKPNANRRGASSVGATEGLREGVREHFEASLNALRQYKAEPLDEKNGVQAVVAMWADHGVWQTVGAEVRHSTESTMGETNVATDWIMDYRATYGPGGWEKLLPGSKFTCELVGGDHFSIMRRPVVADLAAKIGTALTSS